MFLLPLRMLCEFYEYWNLNNYKLNTQLYRSNIADHEKYVMPGLTYPWIQAIDCSAFKCQFILFQLHSGTQLNAGLDCY